MKPLFSAVILVLALSACATAYNPRYRFNEIVVNNNTQVTLKDLSFRSGERLFSCGNVAPLGICSNRLVGYVYSPSQVEIEWTLGDAAPRREQVEARVPAATSIGTPLRVVIEMQPEGNVEVNFWENFRLP